MKKIEWITGSLIGDLETLTNLPKGFVCPSALEFIHQIIRNVKESEGL